MCMYIVCVYIAMYFVFTSVLDVCIASHSSTIYQSSSALSWCAGRRTLRSSVHGNLVVPFARSATIQTVLVMWLVQQPGMDFQ